MVREEFKARRYRVFWHHKHGGFATEEIGVWAYNAADAQYQAEVLIKKTIPRDSHFTVLNIEPVDCMGLEEGSSTS